MTGSQLIANERARQIMRGYCEKHDSLNRNKGELLEAATLICLDTAGDLEDILSPSNIANMPDEMLSWADKLCIKVRDKYKGDKIRLLVVAGALLSAEIDRMIDDSEGGGSYPDDVIDEIDFEEAMAQEVV